MSEHENELNKNDKDVGWHTDTGPVRSHNEDSLAAVDVHQVSESVDNAVGIYAVADGAGGHQGGEIASNVAVRTAIRQIMDDLTNESDRDMPLNYRQWLHSAVHFANQMVNEQAALESKDMKTTLVMAVVVGNNAHIVNVGDSRAYIITKHDIRQVTVDHSYVQKLVEAEVITEEEAKNHPFKNVLTQSLGSPDSEVIEDFYVEYLTEDSYLLLCSDGLYNELDEREIMNIVSTAASSQAACEALIAAANEAGGNDNTAAVVVHLKPNSGIS